MQHPYRRQPARSFWKKTIPGYHPMDIPDWYEKRFDLEDLKIATAGSCFAQHIGRHMRQNNFKYMDMEPAPAGLPKSRRLSYGYEMYSARYGNVYTSRQLLQLHRRAFGRFRPLEGPWAHKGGVVDPFRPTIEPEPFGSVAELEAQQRYHLEQVAQMFRTADVFVFTLGLTEAWLSRNDGAAFPLCPGTAGGDYRESDYQFHNLTVSDVLEDMHSFIAEARKVNPTLKFLFTVSPVPLMATASPQQVAVATSYSKAVLRAAAGELYDTYDFVDYFPSYEIITSPFMKGYFFKPDAREVSAHGVEHVMSVFFSQHHAPEIQTKPADAPEPPLPMSADDTNEEIKCDEEILDAYRRLAE